MVNKKEFDLFQFHNMFEDDILLLYKGPFEKNILSVYTTYIDAIVRKYPKISNKVLSIFIELAQNISFYSAELRTFEGDKPSGAGTLVIGEFPEHYTFFSGNMVSNEQVDALLNRCSRINELDRAGLRKFRKQQLNLVDRETDSANIGLIQVALTANDKLDININPVDKEKSFFSLIVKVSK